MIVLLHGNNPWNVVESHSTEAEVSVIGYLAHFLDEAIEIGSGNAVDGSDEIGGCKTVVVSRGTAAL